MTNKDYNITNNCNMVDCGLTGIYKVLKMDAVWSSEMLIFTYKFKWCYNSDDQHGHGNMVSLCWDCITTPVLRLECSCAQTVPHKIKKMLSLQLDCIITYV